jgi:peptidoglycan/LPS O-acetylase OafA/YrhL
VKNGGLMSENQRFGEREVRKQNTIGSYIAVRDNNFNLLRMLAAIGVLVSHAYPLSLGPTAQEPLASFLKGMTLGTVSVLVFFAISGFFITKSFLFSASWQQFLVARILRLFPALAVVLLVAILVSGIFLTTSNADEFWSAAPGYFLKNITLFKLEYSLPGVFEDNPYGTAINGSLWTLFYEVVCYAGILIAGLLGILHRPRIFASCIALTIIFCLLIPYVPAHPKIHALARLALPFAIGAGFFLWRDRIPLSPFICIVLGALAIALHGTEAFRAAFVLALSYSVFVLGYWPSTFFQRYNRLGDYSYGTYVYAFPTQQIVASLGVHDPVINIALSLPVTIICAVFSWHLVEGQAMKFKSRIFSNPPEAGHGRQLESQDQRHP